MDNVIGTTSSSLEAIQQQYLTITNNLANAQTAGYKRQISAFAETLSSKVDPAKLGETFLEELAQMVRRRSAALIVIAGRGGHYRQLAGTPLAEWMTNLQGL